MTMTIMEESGSSLLQESLNLGDVFGSRYLGDFAAKESSALITNNQRDKHAASPTTQECSDSESDSDGDNNTKRTAKSTATSVRQQRRRRVTPTATSTSVAAVEGVAATPQRGGGPPRPTVRRATSQKDNDERRKTPTRQRTKRVGDPRAQNTGIATQSSAHDEKEKHRGVRRAVSQSQDLSMCSPMKTARRLVRKDTAQAAEIALNKEPAQRRQRSRTSSPRRCASPRRRASSPRKYKDSSQQQEKLAHRGSNSSGRSETKSHHSEEEQEQHATSTPQEQENETPEFPSSLGTRPFNPSPRSLNEAEDELIKEASRGRQQNDNHLKHYNGNRSSSEDDSDENNNDDDDDDDDDDNHEVYPTPTVLQFDPTQADGVFQAKQVNTSADLHMKNKDGTECVFNISGIEDPLGSVFGVQTTQPMFDFLSDQPDEEQQEHTESAEREAYDENIRLREILPPEPSEDARSARACNEDRLMGPKKRPVRVGKPKSNRALQGRVQGTPEARPAPPRRGVKSSKTMPARQVARRGSHIESEVKSHKKLVTDTKNYTQFFKDQEQDKSESHHAETQTPSHRPKGRVKQRPGRALSDDNIGYSESEAEMAPRPRRPVKKKTPELEKKTKKLSQRDNNDSFAHSDTDRIKTAGGRYGKTDSCAMSDTEALHVNRRDFNAGPFPNGAFNAPFNASFSQDENQGSASKLDLFGTNSPVETITPTLFATSSNAVSPGNPLLASASCLVSDADVDTDTQSETKERKKSLKSEKLKVERGPKVGGGGGSGLGISIGRYFGRKVGKGGNATDAETSDAENMSVASGTSRLFGGRSRAKQHHMLLDSGSFSSMEDASVDFNLPPAL